MSFQRAVGDLLKVKAEPTANAALTELAREFVGSAEMPRPAAPSAGSGLELALSDLISDANGEVVLFNDSGFRTLALSTEQTVVADGQAKAHVTASGEDVSGFNFVTFDNGVTLYFQDGLDVILT